MTHLVIFALLVVMAALIAFRVWEIVTSKALGPLLPPWLLCRLHDANAMGRAGKETDKERRNALEVPTNWCDLSSAGSNRGRFNFAWMETPP